MSDRSAGDQQHWWKGSPWFQRQPVWMKILMYLPFATVFAIVGFLLGSAFIP